MYHAASRGLLFHSTLSKYLEDSTQTLFEEVFCLYGIPLVIVSDRDPRLDNPFVSEIAALQGTSQRITTVYRPRSNEQAEALNKELIINLRALLCFASSRIPD